MEKNPNDIVIVSGARTAVAKFGGSLKGVSAIEMGASSARSVPGARTVSSPALSVSRPASPMRPVPTP